MNPPIVLLIATSMFLLTRPLHAQLVADGATNTLSNVTNTFTGDVTVGTNASFTLLVLSDNVLLTNSVNGVIGHNTTAKSNEVRLVSATARWQVGGSLLVGNSGGFNRLLVSNGASVLAASSSTIGNGADFSGNANSNTVTVSGAGSLWSNGLELVVGELGAANRLEVNNGGQVLSSNAFVGRSLFSPSNTVVVTGAGSVWSNRTDLSVGGTGAGNLLVVSNGGWVVNSNAYLGNGLGVGNVALVTGINSMWSNRADLYVGNGARGNQLVVSDGARVVDNSGVLGSTVTSSNNLALVTGVGSLWSNRANLFVGNSSSGNRLVVSNGATAHSGNDGVIGFSSAAGSNESIVTGSGTSWLVASDLYIGSNGPFCRLVITNGGMVTNDVTGVVGYNASSRSNEVVVTGTGSLWRYGTVATIGQNGSDNRLTISGGGRVTGLIGTVGASEPSSNNLAVVVGAGSVWSNSQSVAVGAFSGGNRMIISQGGGVFSGSISYVGANVPGISNTVTVTDPGSFWDFGANMRMGHQSTGNILVVSNGARISGFSGAIGQHATASNNYAVVTGSNSSWTNMGTMNVGFAGGYNRLLVANGGRFADQAAAIGVTGDNNEMLVTDAGTVFETGIIDSTQVPNLLVGDQGSANRLVISNGALATVVASTVIGANIGANSNAVIVDGIGSKLTSSIFTTNSPRVICVGSNGSFNRLIVTNGATAQSLASSVVGNGSGSNNEALVTGPGSSWISLIDLTVGQAGNASRLVISNAATAFANTNIILGGSASSTNNRVVVDGGTLRATNFQSSGTLDMRRGTNVLNAGLIDVDQLRMTNTLGKFEFNGGTLITRGAVISNGLPFVVGASGSTPAVWDVRTGSHTIHANNLFIGNNTPFNQLLVTNGAALTNSSGIIGNGFAADSNTAVVAGAGSRWSPGALTVGWLGSQNSLVVSNGGVVAGIFDLGSGHVAANSNRIVVTDSGTSFDASSLIIGYVGPGNQFTVGNGAVARTGDATVGVNATGPNNVALVTGAGSVWSNSGALYVGDLSSGNQLVVSNGAAAFNASLTAGNDTFASGNGVLVTGGGSSLDTGNVILGNNGPGNQLTVANGAVARTGDMKLGIGSFSRTNQIVVTGAGTLWSNSGALYVGYGGVSNYLFINTNATVSVSNAVYVGFDPGSAFGNRVVVDNGTLRITNASATGLLEIRRGTNVFNSGLIEADILRVTNGTFSKFEVNGGTLAIKSSRVSVGNPIFIGNGTSPATLHLAGNGTHDFTGTLGLIVTNNATLSGSGTLLAQLQMLNGSTLSPGVSVGKISLSGAPFLAGTIAMEISKNGAALTNDQLQVTGTLTYGGTLTVSNLGPTTLAAGDRFPLFSATSYAGSFASITLPPPPLPLSWTNKLLVDGSIEVVAPPAILMSSGTYMQSFDSLAISGGSNPWRDNVTLLGWYAAKSVAPANITNYIASDGSGIAGSLYSFGSTGSSERALGSIGSGSVGTISYGLGFLNDTGVTVSNFNLTFTGEQWRSSSSFNANTLTFWYRVSPSPITNPEPGITSNWTPVTNLDFVSPVLLGTGVPLDGNQASNRQVFSAFLIQSLAVLPGQNVFFRWQDLDDSGTDQGMAVDDLIVNFTPLLPKFTSVTLTTNGFPLLIGQGESNLTYRIEAATNLNTPIFWQLIGSNNTDGTGLFQFTDTNALAAPQRFYRLRWP